MQPPGSTERVQWFNENRPELLREHHVNREHEPGVDGRFMLAVLDDEKLRRVLARMLRPDEFLGDHGIRSISRYHLEHPYVFYSAAQQYRVGYLPGRIRHRMFGGNSNWRGPIWAPDERAPRSRAVQMYCYYGDDFKVECPTGSGST